MKSYQRGNRDGLISFADYLEDLAESYYTEAVRLDHLIRKMPSAGETHRTTLAVLQHKSATARELAQKARRMSESLPHDPEESRGPNYPEEEWTRT